MCGDNNYEEIIDKMMLNEVCGLNENFRLKIESLEHKYQRLAILSLLDKDRSLFMSIKNIVKENKVTKVNHVKDVIKMLREYVKVGEVEKKKYGEVMTPLELVKDMIQTIPNDFWKNPNSKILDPANGVGPFPIMVVYRLMMGLKDWEPDEEKRYKHIMENMIYVCELQPKNMFLWMTAVDPEDIYELNIYNGSFLNPEFDYHMKNVWCVEKFDLILGNPPYQERKEGFKKTQPLWHLFVEKSMSMLSEGGYLNMVHPSGWRNVDGVFKNTQNLLKSKQMLSLKMHTFKDGLDTFGAKINFDYYCLKNSNGKILTKISCENGSIENLDISTMEFIPGENISEIYKLVAKDGEDRVQILHSYSDYEIRKPYMNKEQTDEFKYPCVYMVSYLDVPNFWYSSRNDKGHFSFPKIIWANGSSGVIIDKNGDFALTQFGYAIVDVVENLESIKKSLQSEKFIKEIMLFKNGLGDKYNRKIISLFRKDFWKEFINEENN